MMTVIYVITKILTFPGALTKAFFEHIVCKVLGSPVDSVKYLELDETCGHVDHELIDRPAASFWYCVIPGLLNWFLGVLLGLLPLINVVILGNYQGFLARLGINMQNTTLAATLDFLIPWIFVWLSFSMFCNLAPMYEDALNMKEQYGKLNGFLKVLFAPGFANAYIGSILEKYGVTFVCFAVITFFAAIVT